ncbi:MAG: ERCC4 domain-containing protein [Candidatus Heimdallarchaeota archaeon]|nr:MAG: ERCC4 domain-containing protein [Candidatus Heimdallarchaeota archaeon]
MPRLVLPTYTVIRDTREQKGHGWWFNEHAPDYRPPRCKGTIIDTIETGDYSIVGYTDILAIERKFGFSELWGNYSKNKRQLFEEEMDRMSKIKYSYVIIESSFNPDIMELSPPQFSKNVPGKSLIRWLMSLSVKYGVHIIPVGSCGQKIAQMIFEEVIRKEKGRWIQKSYSKKMEEDYFGL